MGTQSENYGPMLYCGKRRILPLNCYCCDDSQSVLMLGNLMLKDTARFPRQFKLLIGIEPLMQWPYHSIPPIKRKLGITKTVSFQVRIGQNGSSSFVLVEVPRRLLKSS